MNEAEKKKRKGKEILAEKPQKRGRVSEDDVAEFVKTLKRSEYSVVEQLKKQPAEISILSLFLSSEMHRDALFNILKESHAQGTATKDLERIVGQIIMMNKITFNKDELTPEGLATLSPYTPQLSVRA